MSELRKYIDFEEEALNDEINLDILNTSLPNIIDYVTRFGDLKLKYDHLTFSFENIEDYTLRCLLKDICNHFNNNYPSIDDIFVQQSFIVRDSINNRFNTRDFLIKRFENYTPILGCPKRESENVNLNNTFLESL
ncbi:MULTISPECIES: hypothetical protein [Flavobacterium]|uniref:Uncharacterized protein n=1 Tax=Flavobacterium hankyongi TaxID=1176532 RepID=A0ABP8ZWQ8_9FLAO|nr:hypothetical protein [Flavobacterium sp. N1846]